jgi:hypothetical protein
MGWGWVVVAAVVVAVAVAVVAAVVAAAVVLLLLGGWLGFLLVLLPWLSCPTSTRAHLNWTALHSLPVRTLSQA